VSTASIVAERDWLGAARVVYDVDGTTASSVARLLAQRPATPRALDAEFFVGHITASADRSRTVLAAVHELPPGSMLVAEGAAVRARPRSRAVTTSSAASLRASLTTSIERALALGSCAIALSGGLDSAVILALARAIDAHVPAYVLAPRMSGYDESERAQATAARFGGQLRVVAVDERAFIDALPRAIAAFECPLYNTHPVQKLLLAEHLARDGIERVLTGDGADHVVRRDDSADYLPLVGAAFAASRIALCAPFLDDGAVDVLTSAPPDADKRAIRELGQALGVDDVLVDGPKRSQLAPALDLAGLVNDESRARVAALIGIAPSDATDRERVLWTTSALLASRFSRADIGSEPRTLG
jgi:hypothetical protein